MLKTGLLFISIGGLATLIGCAGERKSSGLVAGHTSGDDAVGATYSLVFSAIEPSLDGSGETSVAVKLKKGNVVVTDGNLSRSTVTLLYRVDNPEKSTYRFKEFERGGKRKLIRGAITFRVELEAGEMHQLQAKAVLKNENEEENNEDGLTTEAEDKKNTVSGESGIFLVPGEEQTDGVEE